MPYIFFYFQSSAILEISNASMLFYSSMQRRLTYTGFVSDMFLMVHISSSYFSWLGMLMRSILAAIDWNMNLCRKYKVSESGEPLYKSKVS